MNPRQNKPPQTVNVNGAEYPINTDFGAGIRFEELLIREEPPWEEILNLYYPTEIPKDIEQALERIIWFYRCGEPEQQGETKTGSQNRACDLNADFKYIYAAFMERYRIDLYESEHLHWWKFKALFSSLPQDCEICKIMEYRTADLRGMDRERRSFYLRMRKLYALPSLESEEQKKREEKLCKILMGGGDVSGAREGGEI